MWNCLMDHHARTTLKKSIILMTHGNTPISQTNKERGCESSLSLLTDTNDFRYDAWYNHNLISDKLVVSSMIATWCYADAE